MMIVKDHHHTSEGVPFQPSTENISDPRKILLHLETSGSERKDLQPKKNMPQ